jgi:hypothetical protein
MTAVQIELKNVGAIHELPLHFLCHTQLKTAITDLKDDQERVLVEFLLLLEPLATY